jgi:hypothetical protein
VPAGVLGMSITMSELPYWSSVAVLSVELTLLMLPPPNAVHSSMYLSAMSSRPGVSES